jgi:hypothetical protein
VRVNGEVNEQKLTNKEERGGKRGERGRENKEKKKGVGERTG